VGQTFDGISIVYQDDVISGLDDYVKTHKIDILALFIPARRLWERLFHSSVSQRMVYHSTTPLLIFHE
ncbi:MAG: universal stress protein, partial [Bacteroidetes bacterium]